MSFIKHRSTFHSVFSLLSQAAAILCLLAGSLQVEATQWQNHDAIRDAARQFVHDYFDKHHRLDVKIGYLDQRLHLSTCQGALHAFMPVNTPPMGTTTIGIRCEFPGWKVHVSAQVRVYTRVVVSTRPITRGSLVQAADLGLQEREISRYRRGVYASKKQLLGMVARRPIRQDAVLTPTLLKPRRLVNRGQPVTIVAEYNGLQIRTQGEALADGHKGQIIRVENSRSGKQLAAEVIAPATVKVKM